MKRLQKGRSGLFRAAAAGALALGFVSLLILPHSAEALRVTMKRVIFEGPVRTELLTIVNNTAEEQAYRLGWRMMRMTEDSTLEYVKEGDSMEGLKPADEMIRYSPRRVVLPPGSSQQVRLMLRRPKDLPEGEYRSHFWIQPEAPAQKFTPEKQAEADSKPVIQIKMLTGMTVPVFVRNGNLTASASITDAKAVPGKEGMDVSFTLNREGNRSLYGDFAFTCNGKLAKEVQGIAVYTEVTKRHMKYTVPYPEGGGAGSCSQLGIKYTSDKEDLLFKGKALAEASVGG
jgi:P pilus assembly chaperone PapD